MNRDVISTFPLAVWTDEQKKAPAETAVSHQLCQLNNHHHCHHHDKALIVHLLHYY